MLKNKTLIMTEKMDWIFANTACRAAIKAGNKNSREEIMALVSNLEENPELKHCPHGRPITIVIKKRELEKQFGRIQ